MLCGWASTRSESYATAPPAGVFPPMLYDPDSSVVRWRLTNASVFWSGRNSGCSHRPPPAVRGVMEKLVDTVIQRADKAPVSSHREACLVHIYPTGPWMGM